MPAPDKALRRANANARVLCSVMSSPVRKSGYHRMGKLGESAAYRRVGLAGPSEAPSGRLTEAGFALAADR